MVPGFSPTAFAASALVFFWLSTENDWFFLIFPESPDSRRDVALGDSLISSGGSLYPADRAETAAGVAALAPGIVRLRIAVAAPPANGSTSPAIVAAGPSVSRVPVRPPIPPATAPIACPG